MVPNPTFAPGRLIAEPQTAEEAEALLEQLARGSIMSPMLGALQAAEANEQAAERESTNGDRPLGLTATDRLRHSEARYRTLVEQIPAITFMASLADGLEENEIYVSPHIETMLGFTQQEWLGDPFLWFRQLHPDDRQRWGEEFARTCASGVGFSSEYRFISRDHREVWVHGEARVIRDKDGRPLFLQGIAFDITESKRAERALRRSTEELEEKVRERTVALVEATARAEAANHARASFLANMSHEIRTPLNAIIGFADLLRRGADTGEAERMEWLEIIRTGGTHLLALINDILDLTKIDAGKLTVEEVDCSPAVIIEEVCAILRTKAREKGLELNAVFQGPIPAIIRSDPTRLRQVIMNIAGNAIKFTPSGRIDIITRLHRPPGQPAKLLIQVSDTGIGIPDDKLKAIFDPFTQADSSITRKFGGTGLGLAISRKLTELLGGGIRVESEVGRGTTFTFEISVGSLEGVPLREITESSGELAKADLPAAPAIVLNHRILVVDDGETNRKLIKLVLGRVGAQVETAENGQRAIDRATNESFDLILMDMQMPIMDGYAATGELRQRGLTIPIIALTANAMKWDEARCLGAGCSGYLSKPIDQDLLLVTVAAALEASSREQLAAKLSTASGPPAAQLVESGQKKMTSTLPTDDPDFRAIVVSFQQRLHEKMAEMRAALAASDLATLSGLAHWLKGTGGTAGFPAFTAPAGKLERLARDRQTAGVDELIAEIDELVRRIVIE
jgi:PAS domain S-box-containing protein